MIFGADPVLLAVLLLLDAVLGRPAALARLLPDEALGLAGPLRTAVRRLDRPHRHAVDRARRGAVVALLSGLAGAAAGLLLARLSGLLPFGFVIDGLLLLLALQQREPVAALRTVADGLDAPGDAMPVRRALVRLGIDPAAIADRHGLARAAVEAAAARATAGLCGPVLFYLVLGLPGLGALLALRACEAVVAKHASAPFARGAARLHDIVLWPAALLASLLLTLGAAFAPGARADRALRASLRDAAPARARIAPVAALAGAYDLALLGPHPAGPLALPDGGWVGEGTARLDAGHVRKAAALLALAALLQFAMVLVVIAAD